MEFIKNRKWLILCFTIIAVLLLIIIFDQSSPLPNYIGITETLSQPETEDLPKVDTVVYKDDKTGFMMDIPADWSKVIKDGCTTFIHSASASSVQIKIQKYFPQVTTPTKESKQADIVTEGNKFINFVWFDNSSYMTAYQVQTSEESVTDYIETVYFDRQDVITVTYTVNDKYYSRLSPTLDLMMESASWEKEKAIPETLHLYYNEFGNFEFAVPNTWETGIVNGSFVALDKQSGCSLTVAAVKNKANYSSISQLDYTNTIGRQYSGFSLKEYRNSANAITATGVYSSKTGQIITMHYMFTNGVYEYSLLYECPVSVYQQQKDLFEESAKLFRTF